MPLTLTGTPEQIAQWKADAEWWGTYYAMQGRDYEECRVKYLNDIAEGQRKMEELCKTA